MKITVLDAFGLNQGDLNFKEFEKFGEVVCYDITPQEEVVARSRGSEVLFTNKTKITAEMLRQLPEVKYIGILATGFNVVDVKEAGRLGITVTNIPAYSTMSVAQMVFAHILNITNHVAHYADATRQGVWSSKPDFCYWDTPLPELAGKTLGIVGLGHIGKTVAQIAHCFGMYISAYTSKNSSDLPEWIQKTTIDGLFAVSDILTLHCPLTPETRELVNKQTLAKMRKGAIIINTGRGPLVNEADVAEALKSGKLAAYGADVMCSEPPSKDNPLLAQPHAFLTPHVAWATFEARTRLMDIALGNVKAFVEGAPTNVVG